MSISSVLGASAREISPISHWRVFVEPKACPTKTSWWFQISFIFTPTLGKTPNLTSNFASGLKPASICVSTIRQGALCAKILPGSRPRLLLVNTTSCWAHRLVDNRFWGLSSQKLMASMYVKFSWPQQIGHNFQFTIFYMVSNLFLLTFLKSSIFI